MTAVFRWRCASGRGPWPSLGLRKRSRSRNGCADAVRQSSTTSRAWRSRPLTTSRVASRTAMRVGVVREDPNRPEPRQELVEAAEPIRRPFLDHLDDQVVEFGRDQLVMVGQRDRPFAQVLLEQLLRRIGAERRAAACQFIAGDPETVNIGPRRRRLATNLLGRHVRLRSLPRNLALEHLEEAGRHPPGQRIVDHPNFARLVEQDVLGLHVAVHPALIMHVRKSLTRPAR